MDTLNLDELAGKFEVALRDSGMAANTVRSYTGSVRALQKWQHENGKNGLGLDDVRGFIGSVLDGGSRATAVTRVRGLRAFGAWAARDGHTGSNELTALKTPKKGQRHMRILEDEEVERLFSACRAPGGFTGCRDEALALFYAYTGARASEALDLDLPGDLIMTPGKEAVIFRAPKGNKARKVPLVGPARDAMARYLAARQAQGCKHEGPLWVSDRRGKLSYSAASTLIDRRAQAAGIDDFHLHMLRNWFAVTWLMRAGSESGLRHIAGWVSNEMLQLYVKAAAGKLADAEARRLFG